MSEPLKSILARQHRQMAEEFAWRAKYAVVLSSAVVMVWGGTTQGSIHEARRSQRIRHAKRHH